MERHNSRLARFQNTSRWHFAGFWAGMVALIWCTDFLFSESATSRIAFRQAVAFALTFVTTAFVVWPLRERQRRTGFPFSSIAVSVLCIAFVYPCASLAYRLTRESAMRFLGDSGTIEFSRVHDPFVFWMFPIVFAISSLLCLIFGIYHLRVFVRRARAARSPQGEPR